MSATLGSTERPLRVAIIGAGPSGYYAAGALTDQKNYSVSVDILDRLPTPYGLVRYGVAPDHPKIKSVIRIYEKLSLDPRVRFFGNVEFGKDITHDEMHRFYDAVIYAYGSPSDRKLGIPGEELRGAYSATEFVAWYNTHPDYTGLQFDLERAKVAVVVGNGNVAMDVVRILAETQDVLSKTDIADYALQALARSPIQKIYQLGRRGPAQAAFTNPELREFGDIADADVVLSPQDLELDPNSQKEYATDKDAAKNVDTLRDFLKRPLQGRPKQIIMKFLTSPVEIIGKDGRMVALKMERNELVPGPGDALQAKGTGVFETIDADIIFRAIGYKGLPMPGVPYDQRSGTIPNDKGRVKDPQSGQYVSGEYVVGWAKRGPTGIIGTNKPDALETVQGVLADVPSLKPAGDADASPAALEAFLRARKPELVNFKQWQTLDQIEVSRGQPQGRPRSKITSVGEMLTLLKDEKAK